MKTVKGIAIILAFLALGQVCSILIGGFIPAFVGIMNQWDVIRTSFFGWCIVLVATTLIVIATSGLVAETIIRRTDKKKREDSHA